MRQNDGAHGGGDQRARARGGATHRRRRRYRCHCQQRVKSLTEHNCQSPSEGGPRCGRGTAFILAAYSGRVDAAAALIFAGANVYHVAVTGSNARQIAQSKGLAAEYAEAERMVRQGWRSSIGLGAMHAQNIAGR